MPLTSKQACPICGKKCGTPQKVYIRNQKDFDLLFDYTADRLFLIKGGIYVGCTHKPTIFDGVKCMNDRHRFPLIPLPDKFEQKCSLCDKVKGNE